MQSHIGIPKNIRTHTKAIVIWYPDDRKDTIAIPKQSNALTNDELANARGFLKKSEIACLYSR